MDDCQEIRIIVGKRIDEVEQAVQNLQDLRKTLMLRGYEAKQNILNAFSRQRESMRSREIFLLNQVDTVLQTKDQSLVTQLTKLNQVLGCLRNCLQSPHPCGECLEKFDDIDLMPIEDMSVEFACANDVLRKAVHEFGRVTVSHDSKLMTQLEDSLTTSKLAWLFRPLNSESPSEVELIAPGETMEWLMKYHPSTTDQVADLGDYFLAVKSQMRDSWLDSQRVQTSLYTYVMTEFKQVMEQSQRDWLYKDHHRSYSLAEMTESSSTCSEMSSCTNWSSHSSCVVITSPSHTSNINTGGQSNSNSSWHEATVTQMSATESTCEWVISHTPSEFNLLSTGNSVDWLRQDCKSRQRWLSHSDVSSVCNEDGAETSSQLPSVKSMWLALPQQVVSRHTVSNSWLPQVGQMNVQKNSCSEKWLISNKLICTPDKSPSDAWLVSEDKTDNSSMCSAPSDIWSVGSSRRNTGWLSLSASKHSQSADWLSSAGGFQGNGSQTVQNIGWLDNYCSDTLEKQRFKGSNDKDSQSTIWLHRSNATDFHISKSPTSIDWLTKRRSLSENWLPGELTEVKGSEQAAADFEDWLNYEKHDISVEKICEDEGQWVLTSPLKKQEVDSQSSTMTPKHWLVGSVNSKVVKRALEPEDDCCSDWLTGDEKGDSSAKCDLVVDNKEWLQIMQHVKDIVVSKESDWLFHSYQDPLLDNKQRLFSNMGQWLH